MGGPPVLLVVPHRLAGGDSVRGLVLGGLPVLRRIALAAQRAGVEGILMSPRPGDEALLAGAPIRPLTPASAPGPGPRRVILLADCVVPQPAWLRHLISMPVEPERLYVDGGIAAVMEAGDAGRLVAAASTGAAPDVLARLRRETVAEEGPLSPGARFAIGLDGDGAAAERWLLEALIKPGETFMSRHFERRLSLAVTRRLAPTSFTPNAMSVVMIAIGLLGAPCFLSASAGWQLAGAVLFLVHSILDGCDGELARLKFLESPGGATLDFWGDNIVHSAVFGCMAIGWSLEAQALWPLGLGAIVVGSTLAAAATLHGDGGSGPESGTSAVRGIVAALSNRSFIYLVALLAAFGRAWWFLVPAAIGTPAFVGLALWARRGRRPGPGEHAPARSAG